MTYFMCVSVFAYVSISDVYVHPMCLVPSYECSVFMCLTVMCLSLMVGDQLFADICYGT